MNELLDSIIEEIKNSASTKATKLLVPGQESVLISNNHFHDISDIKTNKKIAFIDGGNNEIIKTPSMSLQLVRVYYNIFQNNKKIKSDKCEFYVLVKAKIENEKIVYCAKIFVIKQGTFPVEKDLAFASDDFTLKEGVRKASISKIGEIARRFTEWTMCIQVMQELSEGDFIVKDGTLDIEITGEKKYKDLVVLEAGKRKINIAAIAKTTDVLADNGETASKVLIENCKLPVWKYYPVVKQDKIYFVKLNLASKHVFKLEIIGTNEEMFLSMLVENSRDAIFPGYPYGLVDADRFARVSNQERDYLRAKLEMKMGKGFAELDKAIKAGDAHRILDNVS